MLKIGEHELDLVKRDLSEIDTKLIEMTGVCAAEMHKLLKAPLMAGLVAAAILPLLAEPMERYELAQAISDEGVWSVQQQVHDFYDQLTAKDKKSAGNN